MAGLVSQFQYWLPYLVTEDAWFRLQYPPLYRILPKVIIVESLEFLLHWVYTVPPSPNVAQFQLLLSILSSSISHSIFLLFPFPPTLITPEKSILFPLFREIHVSLLVYLKAFYAF